jgi:hypothetical protein
LIAAFALLALAPLSQAKVVVNGFGTSGTLGGQFGTAPRGVAVNNSGNGGVPAGTFYVVDGNQNRVQRFSPAGAFERAWGFDVVTGGVATFEVCTVASECKAGVATPATANGGQLNNPQGVAVNQANGDVYVTESTNRRVSEFDASGNFVRTWGWDVVTAGKPNDKGTNAFEVCSTTAGNVAADCKQAAAAGPQAGQFGPNLGYPTLDSSNNVWVPDAGNSRIQEFSSTGAFLKVVGTDVITDGAEGTGNLSNGSTTVGSLSTTKRFFEVGQTITAPSGIQAETVITAVTATSLTLSKAANATVAGQTLTVAAGAGNMPVNEQQTITVEGGATGGSFNLAFGGQDTKFTGTANFVRSSAVVTNVVTSGNFEVGQGITGPAIAAGTTIAAVDNPSHTLTLSNPAFMTVDNQSITGFSVLRNSTAAALQAKLEALSSIGAGNVAVSGSAGGPWTVTFQGSRLAGADVPQMTATPALSPAAGTVAVTSANPGALETCSVPADCRTGAPGNALGQFGATSPGDLAFDSGGNLYAIDTPNKRVEQFNPALTSATGFGAAALSAFTNVAPERLLATQGGTRLDLAVNNTVNAIERQIVELDTAAAVKDTSLVGGGLEGAIGGLGANAASGNLYATTAAVPSPRRVLVLSSTPLPAPVPVTNPIATKTDTTATFSGTVDPTGGLVSCKFEYSLDQATWTSMAVPGCDTLTPGGGPQAVSASVTGLIPSGHYSVRLAVSRPLVANSTALSLPRSFDTDSVPPAISNVGAVEVTDVSARLVATIDPKHSPTAYVFEYGPTPALGNETAPVGIGSGTTPLTVSQVVSGLSPATTYYFRVAATNLMATTRSASSSLTTRAAPLPLPDDRRYEQVSPIAKGFANIDEAILGDFRITVSDDGDAVGYCNAGAGGAQIPVRCGNYISRRDPQAGWQTRVVTPRSCSTDLEAHVFALGGQTGAFFSNDLRYAVIAQPEAAGCGVAPLDPLAPLPGLNLYRESLTASPVFDLLTPGLSSETPRSFNTSNGSVQGGSRDFSHVVLRSTGSQCQPSCGGFAVDGTMRVFEWVEGEARLVARGTNDLPLAGPSTLGGNGGTDGGTASGSGAVSVDGTRIYFQNRTNSSPEGGCANANCELYLRKDGTTTAWVSEQECSPACPNNVAGDAFLLANPAGDRALFATGEKLVNADDPSNAACPGTSAGFLEGAGASLGCDLYEYRDSPEPGSDPHNLTDLSMDSEPADGVSGSLLGVLGMSDDGNVAYFVAAGQLVSGGPTAAGPKLYRWTWNGGSPQLRYLATLSGAGDGLNWHIGNQLRTPFYRVDGAGKHLLIESKAALDPVADTDANRDIYRWGEGEGMRCLSCQSPGVPPTGNAELQLFDKGVGGLRKNNDLYRVASGDLERVFFTTPDALVPGDVNGQASCPLLREELGPLITEYRCQDVYEWHDGRVSLISTGTGNTPTRLIGTTVTGDDVFFLTGDQLVGWDTDDLNDIYDARVGGGFPEPDPEGSCDVNAGACEGPASSAPTGTGAGTAVFESPNPPAGGKEAVTCRKGFRKVKVKGRFVCRKVKSPHKKPHRHTTGKAR